MNIKGMDIFEISKLIQPYIVDYFKDCSLQDLGEGIFSESHSFDFTEVKHLIPVKYHTTYGDADLFRGSSGYIIFDKKSDKVKDFSFIAMLITNEEISKALFLYLQEENNITHECRDILITDFLKDC